ncbi:MAG: response regulator [Planctomycetes bacterium]|nr:response regulator [Planctomycetota bacterium]
MDGLEVLMPLGLRSGWECNSIQVMIRLLFIDDDPGVQKTLKMVLSESYQVISAFTGNAGLNALKEMDPDVVLLDINLPDKDGLDVLEEIVACPSAPPVIMLTA